MSRPDPPHRDELIDALEIPARLNGCDATRLRRGTGGEITIFFSPEVFALQLEVGVSRVVVRRPFQDSVQHPKTALAGKAVGCPGWIIKRAVLGRGAEVLEAGLPGGPGAQVAANGRENVARAEALLGARSGRARGRGRRRPATCRL